MVRWSRRASSTSRRTARPGATSRARVRSGRASWPPSCWRSPPRQELDRFLGKLLSSAVPAVRASPAPTPAGRSAACSKGAAKQALPQLGPGGRRHRPGAWRRRTAGRAWLGSKLELGCRPRAVRRGPRVRGRAGLRPLRGRDRRTRARPRAAAARGRPPSGLPSPPPSITCPDWWAPGAQPAGGRGTRGPLGPARQPNHPLRRMRQPRQKGHRHVRGI